MTVLLDAKTAMADQGSDGALRFAFNVASADEMKILGAAFARAVLPHKGDIQEKNLRIGLDSEGKRGRGKSTFVQGMLGTIKDKTVHERVIDGRHEQSLWRSPSQGWLRHYDCFCVIDCPLSSYRDNRWEGYGGEPIIDIAEHPDDDIHDEYFHYLVFFQKDDFLNWDSALNRYAGSETRTVTIALAPEFASAQKFQVFLDECQSMRQAPQSPAKTAPFF